ncbi:MAG: glycosyltransferase family 4 protein [Candidatus Glassbacteria bacterium]
MSRSTGAPEQQLPMNVGPATRKLIVIPNDPISRYQAKGETRERYFNPGDYFQQVHVFSLADSDEAQAAAAIMSGGAEVFIHPLGRPGLFSWRKVIQRAESLARKIAPQAVRGYNPLFMGWLAVQLGRSCGAVSVVSVHSDYDLARNLKIYGPGFLATTRAAYQILHRLLGLYRTSLGEADQVICAYRFPLGFVGRWRKEGVSVIYHRVDLDRFQPAGEAAGLRDKLRILTVGRQFSGKDPEPIIRAAAGLAQARLTLVGDGPYHERLVRVAGETGCTDRIRFVRSVPHAQIPDLYRSHDIYAQAITHPGLCIPVLEAAASALPVVINQPVWEDRPELVGDLAEVVPLSSDGYRRAFEKLLADPEYRRSQGQALRRRAVEVGGNRMEQAEMELYRTLIENRNRPKFGAGV